MWLDPLRFHFFAELAFTMVRIERNYTCFPDKVFKRHTLLVAGYHWAIDLQFFPVIRRRDIAKE
jgi:hypothetical protein